MNLLGSSDSHGFCKMLFVQIQTLPPGMVSTLEPSEYSQRKADENEPYGLHLRKWRHQLFQYMMVFEARH